MGRVQAGPETDLDNLAMKSSADAIAYGTSRLAIHGLVLKAG
jgi:hypothetical protein